jgi:hypothetical protein
MDAARDQITVESHLERSHWQRYFAGIELALTAKGTTLLDGLVSEQTVLHGLLEKIRDLGWVLVVVQRLEA